MKRFYSLLLVVFALLTGIVYPQNINNYNFTSTTGVFNPITGTVATVSQADEGYANNLPIGFTFKYMGAQYTTFSASTNGFIALGQSLTNSYSSNDLDNVGGGNAARPIIAPLWDDLALSTTSGFSYETTGEAPNRILTAQWLNVKWNYNGPASVSMQVKLYETTGKIEFVYQPLSGTPSVPTASVGLTSGTGNQSGTIPFLSVQSFSTPTVSSVTENMSIAEKPVDGLTFTFTPPVAEVTAPANVQVTGTTLKTISLTWDDQPNESNYRIYRSTNNVDFTLVGNNPANSTNVMLGSLMPSTTYYIRIEAVNELSSAYSTITQATNPGLLSGTKTVGPTGDYASIVSAIADIKDKYLNGHLILELQSSYLSSAETFPIDFGGLTTNSDNTITIRPAADAVNLKFTTSASSTFNMNGVQYLIVDGRAGGSGDVVNLTVENTSTMGTAIDFINDASNNTIKYCNVLGSGNATTYAVVEFNGSTGSTGNDNNTIQFCNITGSGSTTPNTLIYSSGSSYKENNNNKILDNKLYNYFSSGSSSYGINIMSNNSGWSINNNNFYQTANRTTTAGNTSTAISITSGNKHSVTNNNIGGSDINCGGNAWTITNATYANKYAGILLSLTGTDTSYVLGNKISNISLNHNSGATSTPGVFAGIIVTSGSCKVEFNLIGNETSTGSIIVNGASNSNGISYGIITAGSGAITVNNNIISGINITSPTATLGYGFRAIDNSCTGTVTISNNTIGNSTVVNSIYLSATATTASNYSDFTGIRNTATSGNISIVNNGIYNITNNATSTSASNLTRAITSAGGTVTINQNIIKNITGSSNGTGTTSSAPLAGIVITGSGVFNVVGNTIENLNTKSTAATNIVGIVVSNFSTGNTVAKNLIHSFKAPAGAASLIRGIHTTGGTTNYHNNIIRLGIDADGNHLVDNYDIIGIYDAIGTNSYYYNSVYIAGTGVTSGSNNTFAFNSGVTTNVRTFKNNIFVNNRSNSGGNGKHYVIQISGTYPYASGITLNNNIYYHNGTGGVLGKILSNEFTSLNTWRAYTGMDSLSAFADPNFINATGNSSALNLHLSASTPAEGMGSVIAGINEDFDGETRGSIVDIGADAGDFTFVDNYTPIVSYNALPTETSTSTNKTVIATISDYTGVPTTGETMPRVYYKLNSGAWFSNQGNLLNGNDSLGTWDFTINTADLGTINLNDTISYYVVAQDETPSANLYSYPMGVVGTSVNTVTAHPVKPYSFVIKAGIAGLIEVGSTSTYTTLKSAFDFLNGKVLTGNVVIEVAAETITETATATLNQITREDNYTITIKPKAAGAVITGNVSPALIKLNGADYVIFDGSSNGTTSKDLTLTNTNTTANSAVIWLSSVAVGNGASNNKIQNLNIQAGVAQNTANTVTYGIISTGSFISITSGGADNDNNLIENNNISKARFGIASVGQHAANPGLNNVIRNNFIGAADWGTDQIGKCGIYVNYEDSLKVIANTVKYVGGTFANTTSADDRFGIYVGGYDASWTPSSGYVANSTISANNVNNIIEERVNSAVGIALAAHNGSNPTNNIITNNLISAVRSNSTGTDQNLGLGIGYGRGDLVANNTIYLTGDVDPSASVSNPTSSAYGISILTNVNNLTLLNNISYVDLTSSNAPSLKNGCISIPSSYNWGTGKADYNLYYFNPANTQGNVAAIGTTFHTFATWKSTTTQDANSLNGDPGLTSETNLIPDVMNSNVWNINGQAMPLTLVANDFTGNVRMTNPVFGTSDIGAYEVDALTSPNSLELYGNIAKGETLSIVQSGKQVASIVWGNEGTLPTILFVKYFPGIAPPKAVNGFYSAGYWSFETLDGTGYNYNLTLNYNNAILGTIPFESNIKIAQSNSSYWMDHKNSVVDTLQKKVTINGLTDFSFFTLTDAQNPLPVELSGLTATTEGKNITLKWITATEVNSQKFVIERKTLQKEWMSIGEVKSSGNSVSNKEYSFVDKNASTGKISYRLKMVDIDGTFKYSKVIETELQAPKTFALTQNYPNPFNPSTRIDYQLPMNSKVVIELYSMVGEKVAVLVNEEKEAGYHTLNVNASNLNLSSGVYIYRISAVDNVNKTTFSNSKKMILIK